MKTSFRVISAVLIGILVLGLALPMMGYADPGKRWGEGDNQWDKGNGNGPPAFVYEKMLEKFTEIDGTRIKVRHQNVKFDTPPVIKEGRTLIPVRAVTEAMGGTVVWDGEKHTVTITHPDSDKVIVFYLDTGVVEVDGEEVEIDVRPGLHNNRTYVPLRFIAETFGLKVNYGNGGEIDIEDGPVLTPAKVAFEEEADVEDVVVKLTLNDFTFKGIKGLDEGDEYTYDEDDAEVTIKEAYILDLDVEKTALKFQFEDDDDAAVEKTFRITLEYNEEEEEADEEPAIAPEKVTFEEKADVEDVVVKLTLNGYTFEGIEGLDEDEDYSFDEDDAEVTLLEVYLKGLDDEEKELKFVFEKDAATVKESFEIKLAYNEVENPAISPDEVSFDSLEVVTDVEVTLTLNGGSFEGIKKGSSTLEEGDGEDYTLDGNTVTLDDNYLKSLGEGKTVLKFLFENSEEEDVILNFEVEIED